MRLIITEKNNSAQKIAEILSNGAATEKKSFTVPVFRWEDSDGETAVIGTGGHFVGREFPQEKEYKQWKLDLIPGLIDAPLETGPIDGKKNVIKAVQKEAKQADSLVIGTDFDREGELIGLEALEVCLEVNPGLEPTLKRARYSALTKEEIEGAFDNLDELSYPLANAAGARQDIDLIWGAAFTRAVSLVAKAYGANFLSVGRVQSPTLGLIVERELERRAHVAKPFWELFAKFEHPSGHSFEAHHATDKFWDKGEADAALKGTASPGAVKAVTSRKSTSKPPTPYNTNSFQVDASSRLGITPKRAMDLAQDLYDDGFISYPRTDNTIYPDSLPLEKTIASLVKIKDFAAAAPILDKPLHPTQGKKFDAAHPPIYPTHALYPSALDGPKARVYELIVRRFLATFGEPMVTESTRADIEAGSETYFVRGKVVLDPGYAGIYTYARSADEEIPALEEGQQVALDGAPWLIDKETQPPARLSEAKLVQLMDEQGLGTKATRPDIIQKLYNRRYVRNHPPEPTATGIAMYEAFKEYVPDMATSEMTASLEGEMDEIAEEKMTKDEVVEDSRKLVHKTFKDLLEGEEALSKMIWEGMDRDRILGPCIVCQEAGRTKPDGSPNMLRIIRAKKSGKSFVGCTGWEADNPESCDQTFPMPQPNFYEVTPLEENCSVCHRTPRVNVKTRGRAGRPWKLCFNDDCPTMVEMREKKAERLAAQEAAKKAKEAKEAEEKASGKKKPAKKSSGKKSSKKATTVAARIASPPDLGTRRVRKAGSRKGGSGGASKRKG
ncbi:MAG TPA: DNA topoisomerase I [Solirubrobacterales bacterium]|nr:DNA topoisomerase I [Solirubrobacterales bacterium]